MIRYIKYEEIDKGKWDDCIRYSFNGNVYGFSWYLDVVAEYWDALIEDDYERVFPLTWKRKMGIRFLYQPFFTQQLGIFSKKLLTRENVELFLSKIPPEFKHVDILLNSLNKVDDKKYKVISQINHELDLIKSYDNLFRSFSKNLKRNIKKTSSGELTLVKSIKPETLVDLFRDNKGQNISHLKDYHYRRMKRLIYTCLHHGSAEIFGVFSDNNTLCAGACFIRSHKKSIFLFSGLSEDGRDKSAMPFLLSNYIKSYAGSHLTLDFDGSNDPNLARFYKSFGSMQTNYSRLIINRMPWYLNIPYRFYKKTKKG